MQVSVLAVELAFPGWTRLDALLLPEPPLEMLLALALTHVGTSIAAAYLAYRLLPETHRRRKAHVMTFFFISSLLIPVFGAVGVMLFAIVSRRYARPRQTEVYRSVELPEFFEGRARIQHSYGVGGLQARLRNSTLPTELRVRALLAVQDAPPRLSGPIMHALLGDPADDVRLLAYGLLSNKEKALNDRIHTKLREVQEANDARDCTTKRRTLGELYWELVYQGLIRGDLLRHALSEARRYCLEAIETEPENGALWALLGKINLRERRLNEAEDALKQALIFGYPIARLIPYLAEAAFLKRDFGELRRLLYQVSRCGRTEEIDALVRYWCGEAGQ